MLIGILETGRVNEALVDTYGDYPNMFAKWLGEADPTLEFRSYAVLECDFPSSGDECDAWLVTGSRFGIYDDERWIAPLKTFLRTARALERPILGICFGHQIVAEAFGGKAVKSDQGWGVGVRDYQLAKRPSWMADAPETLSLHGHHQDQVVEIPEDATCLASDAHCKYGVLVYGDPEAPDAFTIQPHPEFGMEYARDLVALFRGERIPEDRADPALETFGRPVHRLETAHWSVNFLRRALERRKAA